MGSKLLLWLVCVVFAASRVLLAQNQADPALQQEIRTARARLQAAPDKLSAAELDRLSQVLGRSNHLARAIINAFERNDTSNGLRLLKDFPGKIDDLDWYGEPMLVRAVNFGRAELAESLLAHGANPNARPRYGNNALC